MKSGSPLPAVVLSAIVHLGAWALLPRGGSAILGPPGDAMPPLVWVDVAEVFAMPGSGTDMLAGPGSSRGGATLPFAAAESGGGGRAPTPVDPGRPDPGDEGESATGGPAPLEATVVDAPIGGVPVATAGDPGGAHTAAEARDAALRALALDALLTGGAEGLGQPGFGDGTEAGAGGTDFGLGHRQGTATDPEIVRWMVEVRRRLRGEFHPLPSLRSSHPDLRVHVRLVVDPVSGRVVERSIARTSGLVAYDRAALAAVDSVGALPPVPERWRETLAEGLEIRFSHDL